jgi:hypothetical protein
VSTFVPKSAGEHSNPHVTTGVAPRKILDAMLKEPFVSFTFAPASAVSARPIRNGREEVEGVAVAALRKRLSLNSWIHFVRWNSMRRPFERSSSKVLP